MDYCTDSLVLKTWDAISTALVVNGHSMAALLALLVAMLTVWFCRPLQGK